MSEHQTRDLIEKAEELKRGAVTDEIMALLGRLNVRPHTQAAQDRLQEKIYEALNGELV